MTEIAATAPRMLPVLNDRTRPYWTGGATGEMLISRCGRCRRWTHPPVSECPSCGSSTQPEAVSGHATVFTFTVNEHAYHPDVPPPYVIAVVELDEQSDVRVATNIVNCEPADVRCGMKVRVVFEPQASSPDVFVPLFEPAL